MEQVNVYTSGKKSLSLLLLGLVLVVASVWSVFVEQDRFPPIAVKITGSVGALFFGVCLVNIIRRLVVKRLFLIIDSRGICVDTLRAPNERIEWKYIENFTKETIGRQKFIVIRVNNPAYWIEKETGAWRRRLMKINCEYNGSPFHIATGTTQMGHDELWMLLSKRLHLANADGRLREN